MGVIDVYIPRTASGDLLTGECGKASPRPRSVEVRTFIDPMADHNLSNALPLPVRKAAPLFTAAPRGWRLAPQEVPDDLRPVSDDLDAGRPAQPLPALSEPQGRVSAAPSGATCPSCGRSGFRRSGKGLAWHVQYCHGRVAA